MRLIVGLVVVMLLTGCGVPGLAAAPTPTPTCIVASQQFVKDLQSFSQEWQDALNLADQTPRMSLPPQIAHLQEIRRRAQAMDAPRCVAPARDTLVGSMDAAIDGFLAFLSQKPDSEVTEYFETAGQKLVLFTSQIESLVLQVTPAPTP